MATERGVMHEHWFSIDLGDGRHVSVCTCGWASPNVRGTRRAWEAVQVHVLLHRFEDLAA